MEGSIAVQFAGHAFLLLPDRAVFWPARSTLLVADPHFGKAAGFRTVGIPVPSGSTQKDLRRLTTLLQRTAAQRLVILGDFYHSRAGVGPAVLEAIGRWRESVRELAIILVRGNHDRAAGRTLAEWAFQECDGACDDDGVSFSHDPDTPGRFPTLCGHVHPVSHLRDFDGSIVRVPSFVFDPAIAILPAFGTFTGGFAVKPVPGRSIYLSTTSRVVPLPTPA